MAEEVSRRGLLMRLGSREALADAARGIAPLWREVSSAIRPETVSVEQAVATLRQRQQQRGVRAGAGLSGVAVVPSTPAGTAPQSAEPRGGVTDAGMQCRAQAAPGETMTSYPRAQVVQ